MDISIRKQFFSVLKAALFVVVTSFFSTAQAQFPYGMFPPAPYELYPPTAPEFIVGGYTVDWQDTNGSICWLSERVNNGSWAAVPNTYSPTKTITLSRSVGNYDYQVACIDDYGGIMGPISSVGVVSSMPTLDPLDVQLGYSFQVRTGHFDGDGKKDIYIKRTGGHADNGVIHKTILTQNADGNFDVVENPTSGQLSNAAGWSISSGVGAVVNDFNVDGRVDVLLKNLDSVIAGIDDQIVYSTGKFFKRAAQAATAMDFEFEKFFRDTYNWILDPSYFSQAITSNLPAYNFSLDINVYFCSYWFGFPTCLNVGHALFNQTVTLSMLGLSGYESIAEAEQGLASALGFASYDTFECALVCGWIEFYGFYSSTIFTFYDVWTPTTESPGFDDINFSAWARETAEISEDIANGSIPDGEGADSIAEIIESIAGMKVGGLCLGGFITNPELQNAEDCRGFELFAVVGVTAPETEEIPNRQLDKVYITGHRVLWAGPFHLAVEYNSPNKIRSTLSAAPQSGKLKSDLNRTEDMEGNIVFGTANSNLALPPSVHFLALKAKDSNYDDQLNYDLFPQPGTNGYNSNSYVRGLIDSSSSSSTVNFNDYIGGNKPVPSGEFN